MTTARFDDSPSRYYPKVLLFLLLLPFFMVGSAKAMDIFIGAEAKGSLSYYTGKNICRIMNNIDKNLTCQVVAAENSTSDNLTNLQTGALDLALVDTGFLHEAINKTGMFQFQDISHDNVRYLLPLYKKYITLIVRKDAKIKSLEDLQGKRFNIGLTGTEQYHASRTIMNVKNWTKKTFSLLENLSSSQSQDYIAFNRGSVQAMLNIGVHPSDDIARLTKENKGHLVNIDDKEMDRFVENSPSYFFMHIPANLYPHQNKRVATIGTEIVLLANRDIDSELINALLNGLLKKQSWLRKSHPSLAEFNLERSWQESPPIPYHPVAKDFFTQ